jgi:ribosomal-protein-alanine N-acetyltransferase
MSCASDTLPELHTQRLLLRAFRKEDAPALLRILSDRKANTFLPWFLVDTLEEAERFLEERFLTKGPMEKGCCYAICWKEEGIPIGYVHMDGGEGHDFGYGLREEYWRRGIVTEAARRVMEEIRRAGVPYLTATHDVNNPRSGAVMQKLGMTYRYSYQEDWQPKGLRVTFRMYQINLDGQDRLFTKYWDEAAVRFVEENV